MKKSSKLIALFLALTTLLGAFGSALAVSDKALLAAVSDTAEYIYKTVKEPQVGSIGGEWAVFGLARSGYAVPDTYYQDYYDRVVDYVNACNGNLHDKKYTEYSRLIVTLTAIGKDPTRVGKYNLLTPLGDYDKTIWQGLNGAIWALIALDSGNYAMPQNKNAKTKATRDLYVDRILECQLQDGGWSLFGGTAAEASGNGASDPDITGMALQALANYQSRDAVRTACDKALLCMSKQQQSDGGFESWSTPNSESCVQMIAALGALNIPLTDKRFVKNGKTLLDNLMSFYVKGKGFLHTSSGDGSNQMASEQGLYGLIAAQRLADGKNSIYSMSDHLNIAASGNAIKSGEGLEGKNPDVLPRKIVSPGKTFDDINGAHAHINQPAIEALASRAIIGGKENGSFDPNGNMTRAELATIIVNALGLTPKAQAVFTDIAPSAWYAPFVGTANSYGIVNGVQKTLFAPESTVSRQEAAVMTARAAALCGLDTDLTASATRDILAQFGDYTKSEPWARPALAFCYSSGIYDIEDMAIRPLAPIKRCEVAQMLFNLLGSAKLL